DAEHESVAPCANPGSRGGTDGPDRPAHVPAAHGHGVDPLVHRDGVQPSTCRPAKALWSPVPTRHLTSGSPSPRSRTPGTSSTVSASRQRASERSYRERAERRVTG